MRFNSRSQAVKRSLTLVFTLGLIAFWGCGGSSDGPEDKGTRKKTGSVDRKAVERERELARRDKLDDIKMPAELAAEWFYDGDGVYQLNAAWRADGSVRYFKIKPARGSRASGGKSDGKPIVAFYEAGAPRGPYRYIARVMDDELTEQTPTPLADCRYRWYKAAFFDLSGNVTHVTDPVRLDVIDHKVKPAPRKVETPADKKGKKDKDEKKDKDAEEAPETKPAAKPPVVAVLPLQNVHERDMHSREYIGRAVCDMMRSFFTDVPEIDTPDAGYTDYVMQSQRMGRGRWSASALARIGERLGADMVLWGEFDETDTGLKVRFSLVNVETKAELSSSPVEASDDATDEMGRKLLEELSSTLKVTFPEERAQKFSMMWKPLNTRRKYVSKAFKLHDEEKHAEATAAFDAVKPEEVRDAEALLALSESYVSRGSSLKGARLMVVSTRLDGERTMRGFRETLGRLLRNTHDLEGSLAVLAEIDTDDIEWPWALATHLADQALGGRVVRKTWAGPKKDWPMRPPAWEVTEDTMLVNPQIAGAALVVFGTTDRDVTQQVFPTQSRQSGAVGSRYAETARYETMVYDLADGNLRWQKADLMSGVAAVTASGKTLFGMGPKGPLAVSLRTGEVQWQDKSGRLTLPERIHATGVDYGRPWWRTWELRVVGDKLVAWYPMGDVVQVYETQTGKDLGRAHHNGTWSMVGQFFIERPDGLYHLDRGSSKMEQLTAEALADPESLTPRLRLAADPKACVQGNTLFELTRQQSPRDPRQLDYFIVGSDVEKGTLEWIYPLFSGREPVIAMGKLFVPRRSIVESGSTRVEMIDVTAQKMWTIDLSALDLSFNEPTLALPDGKSVLIGTQAAISAEDGKVLWVNRTLPVRRDPLLLGKYVCVPPVVIDPATGKVVMEFQAPEGFAWERADVTTHGEWLIVTQSREIRRRSENAFEGKMWAYAAGEVKPVVEETTPAAEAEAPKRRKLTIDEVEQAFMASAVAPPVDRLTELFETIGTAEYEGTGDPAQAVAYYKKKLEMRPRNGEHLLALAAMMKPYAAMSGRYDDLIAALAGLKDAWKDDAPLASKFAEAEKAAVTEKADAAHAREVFDKLKTAEHDPLKDFPSARGRLLAGALPPFDVAWKQKLTGNSPDDVIIPTDRGVFLLTKRTNTLTAFDPADGKPMWEKKKVQNVIYYHGVLYALMEELHALLPAEGLDLWKKRLPEDEGRQWRAMVAADGRIFVAFADGIQAYEWMTGKDVYRLPLPEKNELEVHGPIVIARSTGDGKTHAFDAEAGNRLWTETLAAWTVYDGKLYNMTFKGDAKKVTVTLTTGPVITGRTQVLNTYELDPDRRVPRSMPDPVAFGDRIVAICGGTLMLINRENGDLVMKKSMGDPVERGPVVSPTRVFTVDMKRDLVAWKLDGDLDEAWRLKTDGRAALALGPGTLYLFDGGSFQALRGKEEHFSETHLKAVASPSLSTGDVAEVARESRVSEARFRTAGAVFEKKRLADRMDDSRMSTIAFYELVNVGGISDWSLMIEEQMKKLSPGERKTRPLTNDELRTLFAEIIQRRESSGMRIIREMINSRDRNKIKLVLELMSTGSRRTYGPVLLGIFREAVKDKQYYTAEYCAEAIAEWRYDEGMSLLVSTVRDADASEALRRACARALAPFDSPAAITALASVASSDKEKDDFVRESLKLLVAKGSDGIAAVTGILKSSSAPEANRIAAAQALADAAGDEAVPALIDVLKNARGSGALKLRGTAASALGPLAARSDDAFNTLVTLMEDSKQDPLVRNACMDGLGLSGRIRAIPHLIEVMQDKTVDNNRHTRMTAWQYLTRISRQRRIGQYRDEWRRWWEENKNQMMKEAETQEKAAG